MTHFNNESTQLTLFTSLNGCCNKQFDANASKSFTQRSNFRAQTIQVDASSANTALDQLDQVIKSLDDTQCISLSSADMPADYFIAASATLKNNPRPNTIARIKKNFKPSRFICFDFDAPPPDFERADIYERIALLENVITELKGAAKLVVPSNSSRVQLPDGQHLAYTGYHVYCILADKTNQTQIDLLREDIKRRLKKTNLVWSTTTKDDKQIVKSIVDFATINTGGFIFDGAPAVASNLKLIELKTSFIPGGFVQLPNTITVTDNVTDVVRTNAPRSGAFTAKFSKKTSTAIAATDSNVTELLLTTVITASNGKTFSIADFIASPHKYYTERNKVRCQTPFRASDSFAAMLRRFSYGVMLYDSGTDTRYFYFDKNNVARIRSNEVVEQLIELSQKTGNSAQAFAEDFALGMEWKTPHSFSAKAIVSLIATVNPNVDTKKILKLLNERFDNDVKTLLNKRDIKNSALVKVVKHSSIESAYSSIKAAGRGVHFLAAAHGSGKTQHVIKPLAADFDRVVGIVPTRLLADSMAEVLNLAHYRKIRRAFEPTRAICVNSIKNPKHEQIINDCDFLAVDEIACIWRDLHTAGSTHGKSAKNTTEVLLRAIRHAFFSVLADADLSNDLVQEIATALDIKVTVHVVTSELKQRTVNLTTESEAIVSVIKNIADNKKVYFFSDSAKLIEEVALAVEQTYPAKQVLSIHSRRGSASTGEKNVVSFIKKPNTEATKYDLVCASPTVLNGISIEIEHFDKLIGVYGGVKTTDHFVQMALRVRTATDFLIGIRGHGLRFDIENPKELLAFFKTKAEYVSPDYATTFANSAFTQRLADNVASINANKNKYGRNLVVELASRGFVCNSFEYATDTLNRINQTVSMASSSHDDKFNRKILATIKMLISNENSDTKALATDIKQQGRDISELDLLAGIWIANTIDDDEADRIRKLHNPQRDQVEQLAKYDCRKTFGLDVELPPELIKLWQRGKLDKQIKLLNAVFSETNLSKDDKNDIECNVERALISGDVAIQQSVKTLLQFLGLETEDKIRTCVLTATNVNNAFTAIKGTDTAKILSGAKLANFRLSQLERPLQWCSAFLRKLGLRLECISQKRERANDLVWREYVVAMDDVINQKNELQPGFGLIEAIRLSAFCGHTSLLNEYVKQSDVTSGWYALVDNFVSVGDTKDIKGRRLLLQELLDTQTKNVVSPYLLQAA